MSFEKASRKRLRFGVETGKGVLTVEDIWELPLIKLDALALALEKKVETSKGKSFLTKTSKADEEAKLQFDIVLHILQTIQKEQEDKKEASTKRLEKQKWMERIERKENEEGENLSLDDMKKKLAELG